MQCLFEEQTTLFHLAEHLSLSLLSLTVNVHNMGKAPRGTREFSLWAGEQPRCCSPCSICIITAAVCILVFREKACSNIYSCSKKRLNRLNNPEFSNCEIGCSTVHGGLLLPGVNIVTPALFDWLSESKRRHMLYLLKRRCDDSYSKQPTSAPALWKSTPASLGMGPEQTAVVCE